MLTGFRPLPLSKDPVVAIIILLVAWLLFCSLFGSYAGGVFFAGIVAVNLVFLALAIRFHVPKRNNSNIL